MSFLFGWIPADADRDVAPVLARMEATLRVHDRQRFDLFAAGGVGVGVAEPPVPPGQPADARPVGAVDGRFLLWMAGEVFASADPDLPVRSADESRTPAFRRALLERWLQVGVRAVAALDGEFHVAIWDARARRLTIANDRFGGLPMYWAGTADGFAFAGGVRGVLAAPGARPVPDAEALREAVSFGGYRLGDRTNVEGIRMVPGATEQTLVEGHRTAAPYWRWQDIQASEPADPRDLVAEVQARWRRSIDRRLAGDGRYGQTLSGGLDSRAILAEAAPRTRWTAITYGVPGCDDAEYAKRAADVASATWVFQPLYEGDWLDARAAHIQDTDGLIDLHDLMHLEALPLQRALFDIHLSGYVGDAVVGPTFARITDVDGVLGALPYYGTEIGLDPPRAVARVREAVAALEGAPMRYVPFAEKIPQATNRWTAAWRPWLRVRKPFVDHELFDFCMGLPAEARTSGQLGARWLASAYPAFFRSIPHQRTGLPVLTPVWRVQVARAWRGGRRAWSRLGPAAGRRPARVRAYSDDDRVWRLPGAHERIVDTILATGSLCGEILGRGRLEDLMLRWARAAAAPAQVVGAMFVFECYHAGLRSHLDARLRRSCGAPIDRVSEVLPC